MKPFLAEARRKQKQEAAENFPLGAAGWLFVSILRTDPFILLQVHNPTKEEY
jgi:hypothetical protein